MLMLSRENHVVENKCVCRYDDHNTIGSVEQKRLENSLEVVVGL